MTFSSIVKIIIIGLIPSLLQSQSILSAEDSVTTMHICNQLDDALIKKDTTTLKLLLHRELSFGHSNGWIETKASLLKDLPASKVDYNQFQRLNNCVIRPITEQLRMVRRDIKASGTYKGKAFEVNLRVMEIWLYEQERWQLVARQSVDFSAQ